MLVLLLAALKSRQMAFPTDQVLAVLLHGAKHLHTAKEAADIFPPFKSVLCGARAVLQTCEVRLKIVSTLKIY